MPCSFITISLISNSSQMRVWTSEVIFVHRTFPSLIGFHRWLASTHVRNYNVPTYLASSLISPLKKRARFRLTFVVRDQEKEYQICNDLPFFEGWLDIVEIILLCSAKQWGFSIRTTKEEGKIHCLLTIRAYLWLAADCLGPTFVDWYARLGAFEVWEEGPMWVHLCKHEKRAMLESRPA